MNAQGQKTGGRQKGTPNKITAEIREFLASLVFDNMDLIRQDVRNMTPEQRASFLPKILPYIVPKQKLETEKDEQDIACDHVKSFLNLAQIVSSWEQDQQPSQSPAEAHYPVPSPEPEPSPTDEDKFQTSNFKLQNLSQRPLNPAEALHHNLTDLNAINSDGGFQPLEHQPQQQIERREETMSDDEILEEISLALKQHCESICRNIKHSTDDELHEPLKLHDSSAPSDQSDNPSLSDYSDYSDYSAPSNNSASSDPSDLSTSSDKPVKRPTKQVQQRTPFYRNIKTKRTLKKRR